MNWWRLNLRTWSRIWRISLITNIIHFWFLSYRWNLLRFNSYITLRRMVWVRHFLYEVILELRTFPSSICLLNRLIGRLSLQPDLWILLLSWYWAEIWVMIIYIGQIRHAAWISRLDRLINSVIVIWLENLVLLLKIWITLCEPLTGIVYVFLSKLLFVHL